MPELKPFCNSCGLCCARVGQMVDQAKALVEGGSKDPLTVAVAKFPYQYNETGRCEQLGEDNRCKVYETRPLVCSIEKIYNNFYRRHTTQKKFYDLSEQECLKMIEENRMRLQQSV